MELTSDEIDYKSAVRRMSPRLAESVVERVLWRSVGKKSTSRVLEKRCGVLEGCREVMDSNFVN